METSKSNAEVAVESLVAYQRGDDETLRRLLDPEAEIYSEPGVVNSGTYHGFEGFMTWIRQWEEAWREARYEPLEFIDVGESHLVIRVRVTGTGAGSGIETEREFGWLYEIKNGRATRYHLYESAEKAVAAAEGMAGR
jgi:ketosteroid isomerase-like protein